MEENEIIIPFSNLSIFEKIKRIIHYIFTVIMYSVFLIMILVFLVIIINFIDQKNNLKKGIQKPALVSAYTIVSPSMVPNINVLDVIITTRVSDPSKIKVGDVITFNSTDYRSSGVTVTHRVKKIEKTSDGKYLFTTKGDANNTEDATRQPFSSIYGKVLLRLPKLGYIQYILSTVLGWLLLIIVPTVLIIGADIIKIIKTIKNDPNLKDKSKKKEPKILKRTSLKKERSRYK
ncbi:signal peptidase I [Clostridium sp. CAG:451]|nr:signal peptidase I [Clostridium sp. CAG:451]